MTRMLSLGWLDDQTQKGEANREMWKRMSAVDDARHGKERMHLFEFSGAKRNKLWSGEM